MCGGLSGAAELCRLLSSCSARGRLMLCLLLGFASVPLPAAPSVFCGVSCRRLPFGGYATFLAPVACPAPAVELCLLGLRCLSGVARFSPLCQLFLWVLRLALRPLPQVTLGGFCPFSDTVCLSYCCAGGICWSATLLFCYRCLSCTGWLAGVCWVYTLCQGAPLGVVTALWLTV